MFGKAALKILCSVDQELQQLVRELKQCTGEMVEEQSEQLSNVRFKRNENLDRLEEMKRKVSSSEC